MREFTVHTSQNNTTQRPLSKEKKTMKERENSIWDSQTIHLEGFFTLLVTNMRCKGAL
jgi:hypothetical protein